VLDYANNPAARFFSFAPSATRSRSSLSTRASAPFVSTNDAFVLTSASFMRTNASFVSTNDAFMLASHLTCPQSSRPFVSTNAAFMRTSPSFISINATDLFSNACIHRENPPARNRFAINHLIKNQKKECPRQLLNWSYPWLPL